MKNRKEGYRFWRLEGDLPALGAWMGGFGGSCGIQEKNESKMTLSFSPLCRTTSKFTSLDNVFLT